MSSESYDAPGADMPGFVQEVMDFVGFTEADIDVDATQRAEPADARTRHYRCPL